MLVMRLPGGEEALIVLHDQHLNMAGQLAIGWGNDEIAAPHPSVIYMARNHDAGWPVYDREPLLGPDQLPLDMPDMPPLVLTRIHNRSILRNYLNNPYTGILGCAHTLGFYEGRKGTSDFLVHHMDEDTVRHPELEKYLKEFERRQAAWTEELRSRSEFLDQLEPEALSRNYTALQVFDTLSLYFCTFQITEPAPQAFPNVLMADGSSTTVSITPLEDSGTFHIDPWPFVDPSIRLVLDRKRVKPFRTPQGSVEDAPTEQVTYALRPR
jgi:Protein of unknown function (DUF3891)